MREVEAAEAGQRMPDLIRSAECGETIVITRKGMPVAHLVPVEQGARTMRKNAMQELMRKRAQWKLAATPTQELIDLRHESHRL